MAPQYGMLNTEKKTSPLLLALAGAALFAAGVTVGSVGVAPQMALTSEDNTGKQSNGFAISSNGSPELGPDNLQFGTGVAGTSTVTPKAQKRFTSEDTSVINPAGRNEENGEKYGQDCLHIGGCPDDVAVADKTAAAGAAAGGGVMGDTKPAPAPQCFPIVNDVGLCTCMAETNAVGACTDIQCVEMQSDSDSDKTDFICPDTVIDLLDEILADVTPGGGFAMADGGNAADGVGCLQIEGCDGQVQESTAKPKEQQRTTFEDSSVIGTRNGKYGPSDSY